MKRAIPILLILVLAVFLRLRGIGNDSLWSDEMVVVTLARLPFGELIRRNVDFENIPPLHDLIIHFWIRLFGDSEASVRMPSAIAGVACVWMTFVLVRRLLGRRVAMVAMLLTSVSPMQIAYSQECRSYTISVFVCLLSTDLFLRLLQRPTQRLHVAYVLVSALALYAHLYGLFTILAQHIYYLTQLSRRKRPPRLRPRDWIIANLAVAALFGPFVPTVLLWTRVIKRFPVQSISMDDITRTYWVIAGSTGLMVLLTALVVIGTVWCARTRRVNGLRMALTLTLVPVVVPITLSVLTSPMYMPRYGITASVGVYALAGAGIVALPRIAAVVVLTVIALVSPFGTAAVIPRAPWRDAGAFLTAHMRSTDLAVVSNSFGTRLYGYYVKRPDVPVRGVSIGSLPVTLPLEGRRVWLVIYDSDYPINLFVQRGQLRIERRFFTWGVLVAELTDDPWPDGTPAGPIAAERSLLATTPASTSPTSPAPSSATTRPTPMP